MQLTFVKLIVAGLKLLDVISGDDRDGNRGVKGVHPEAYAIFSQDGEMINCIW